MTEPKPDPSVLDLLTASVAVDAAATAQPVLRVCVNQRYSYRRSSCAGRGSKDILLLLRDAIALRCLPLGVEASVCFGYCEQGPNVRLAPGGRFWHAVSAADLPGLLDEAVALSRAAAAQTQTQHE